MSPVGRWYETRLESSRTCEVCGWLRRTRGEGWIQKLCDGHAGGPPRSSSRRSLLAGLMFWLEADPVRCELWVHMRRMTESERRGAAEAAEAISGAFARTALAAAVGGGGRREGAAVRSVPCFEHHAYGSAAAEKGISKQPADRG